MTLSSAEKHSNICPWKFPEPIEDTVILSQSSRYSCSTEFKARARTEPDLFNGKQETGDMGNVTSNGKTQASNLVISGDKKNIKQRNNLNSRQKTYDASSKYINDNTDGSNQVCSPEDSSLSVSQTLKTDSERRSVSPTLNGTQNIRLTKDVNNSRPSSRSSTPVLGRKPGASPHKEHLGHPPSTNDQNRSNSSGSLKESQAKDIMISYSHLDKDIMLKLKDALEAHNITVWVDVVGLNAGVNFLNKIGQAIIDSKMFITLLTERTVLSKFCQDELALAYISNKPIFPVSIQPADELFPKIPTGMKLQLARFEWTQISMENFDKDIKVLLNKLKTCLEEDADGAQEEVRDEVSPLSPSQYSDKPLTRKPVLKKRSTRIKLYNKTNRSLSRTNSIIEQTEDIDSSAEFWDRNFGDAKTVQWESFESAFMKDYEKQLKMTYAHSDKEWFIDILRRELEVEDDMLIHKDKYKEFISDECDGKIVERPILKCANDLAVENYTMKEVFNMDSSVRIDAINNLSKFGSVAVVEALLDLLDDQEHDVRASACISLAKSRAGDVSMKIERLMRCLRDTDRFVRESACIALGYLKAETSVPALLQIWRNDYISSVRDAAELALKQIGGEEVNKAMQMTKVLTEEIQELIKVLTGKTTSPKVPHKKWGPMKPFHTLPPSLTTAQHNTGISPLPLVPAPQKLKK